MKKFVLAMSAAMILMAGCGQEKKSEGLQAIPAAEAPKPAEGPKPTEAAAEPPKQAQEAKEPEKKEENVEVEVVSVKYYPESVELIPQIVFEMRVRNGTSKVIDISSTDFIVATVDGEVFEAGGYMSSSPRSLFPGGKVDSFKVSFEIEEEAVPKIAFLAFGKEKEDIFVMVGADKFPDLTVAGKVPSPPSPAKKEPASPKPGEAEVPLGGGVKADNYEN